MRLVWTFLADETGGATIEHALVATLSALAVISMAGTIGLALVGKMEEARQALAGATR